MRVELKSVVQRERFAKLIEHTFAQLHLILFQGVLAPNAMLRAMVVPHGPEEATGKSELPVTEPGWITQRAAARA